MSMLVPIPQTRFQAIVIGLTPLLPLMGFAIMGNGPAYGLTLILNAIQLYAMHRDLNKRIKK